MASLHFPLELKEYYLPKKINRKWEGKFWTLSGNKERYWLCCHDDRVTKWNLRAPQEEIKPRAFDTLNPNVWSFNPHEEDPNEVMTITTNS